MLAAATLTLLLAACGGAPTRQVDEAEVRAFTARGYASAAHAAVEFSQRDWTVDQEPVEVVLARPVGVALAPLLVYLPALGEDGESGAPWRRAWAAAGYAVLSVQPLAEDAAAWRSTLAREGEFKALGQQRYGAAAMRRRVQVLAAVLDEARRRAIAGEADWQGIDWDRRAVAGFDLGAYTAMALAGEQVDGSDLLANRLPARAAIAISPYMNLANGRLDTRYSAIFGPVLSITSDVDGDPLSLVSGPAQRLAPYAGMPAPEKFLLSLAGLPHARLDGGIDPAERDAADQRDAAAQRTGGDSSGRGGGQGGGRRRAGAGSPGGAPGEEADDRVREPVGVRSEAPMMSPTAIQMRLAAAQQISTAFLDAYVKDDPLAREWLRASASHWLGTAGELQRK